MSLRPEEIQRKAIAAGYGRYAPNTAHGTHEDDTTVLSQMGAGFTLGDWVRASGTSAGHLQSGVPGTTGGTDYIGVVAQAADGGGWSKVKTCGVAVAKIKPGETLTVGDSLELVSGQKYAKKLADGSPCGRFLAWIDADHKYAWVSIGGSGTPLQLTVHHHDDTKNTIVSDTTSATSTVRGPLWHVWRVVNAGFTSATSARLMTCLGGGDTHGETPKEGFGWAGVIGQPAHMGWGEIGGNEKSGNQGVLGAEIATADEMGNRINVRGWAGFNARDRYPPNSNTVHPLRFTWHPEEKKPAWTVPAGCDQTNVAMTGTPCDPTTVWWSGTLKRDPTYSPAGMTHTPWNQQWTPQLALERDCCSLAYAPVSREPPDCDLMLNGSQIEANAQDIAGSYEGLIPYGYTACAGRMEHLHATCYHALHIQYLWRSLQRLSDAVSAALNCLDTRVTTIDNFFATKADGSGAKPSTAPCCPPTKWTVPTITGGPADAGDCTATACVTTEQNLP